LVEQLTLNQRVGGSNPPRSTNLIIKLARPHRRAFLFVAPGLIDGLSQKSINTSVLGDLFLNPGFMPHIHCYLDRPSLVWTMAVTELLIGLAYVAISPAFVRAS
jgi:hypothetical protein